MTGYTAEEFNPDLLAEYIHPDDSARYVHLVKITNEWARDIKPDPFSVEVVIDYRIRKKDGRYIKVMRQSTIYEHCRDRSPRSAFNMLTDITGIKTDNSVNLSIASLETGEVYLENRDIFPSDVQFSTREMEILLRLKKGMNSATIADELFISRHTVDTHRRNMLSKTTCRNVMEMVQMASRMGII
jgi:DNA-binding CsgD family transcriptional regulator